MVVFETFMNAYHGHNNHWKDTSMDLISHSAEASSSYISRFVLKKQHVVRYIYRHIWWSLWWSFLKRIQLYEWFWEESSAIPWSCRRWFRITSSSSIMTPNIFIAIFGGRFWESFFKHHSSLKLDSKEIQNTGWTMGQEGFLCTSIMGFITDIHTHKQV